MQTLPLVTHRSLNEIVAWRNGTAITVERFLADVEYLAALLPASKHVLNVCRDRYHFAVGLAAAIVSNKVSLLPPTHTPEMVRQLQLFSADVYCLHDNEDCVIAMPRMLYPEIPEHATGQKIECSVVASVPNIDAVQLVAIVFTSGSTGSPVPHTKSWGSLVRNVQAQATRLGLSDGTHYSIIGTIPPQHMYGFESTVLLPLQSGNALSSAQPFYPADICSAIASTPTPHILVSTPLHLRMLLEAELNVPDLALVLSATAPLSDTLAHKVEFELAAPLVEIYGSTETGQIATRQTTRLTEWQLLPDVKLTQRGEYMWAEGGHIETTVPINDVIVETKSGYFLLLGRKQDLINIAGKRSSLASLNHHLNTITGLIDGAFFMPDEVSHDHVTRLSVCVVAPTLTTASLLKALRLIIDPVFLPRPILFVSELPRNSTGKLPRDALQRLIAAHVDKDSTSEYTGFEPAASSDQAI
ncbi:MAG: acyl-CoA synthetase [Bacteroidia bacterium]|nr:acyl-CoA synthetase [Methylotenera sp.]